MALARDTMRPVEAAGSPRALADRIFFGAMALYCGITILGGFAPTYYLRGTFLPNAPALAPTVVVHGALFTAWVLLYLAQTALIAARCRDVHRRLGLCGAFVIAAMGAIGIPLIAAFERTHGAETGLTLAVHVFANAAPLTLFVAFGAAGLVWRRRSDVHKRLMLFATLALQPAGFARLLTALSLGQGANVPMYALLCAAVPIYDLVIERRVRAVSALGPVLLFGEVYVTDLLFAYIES